MSEETEKIDIEELKRERQRNFEERLRFIDLYVEWLKKTPNSVWSKEQNELIDREEIKARERG